MIYYPLLLLFIVQVSLAYRQDSFLDTSDGYLPYQEEPLEENDIEVERRNNQFLRFGRPDEKYKHEFDDYDEFARPTRAGKREKNDNFIRFGRGKVGQDFLRFGRDHGRFPRRDKENYLRFGRSTPENEPPKKRSKRDVPPSDDALSMKRNDAFLRFGKNSNFMRFGRDPSMQLLKQLQNSEFLRLLAELEAHRQGRLKSCGEVV